MVVYGGKPAEERRGRFRHVCVDPAGMRVLASLGADLWTAPIQNISPHGMAIVLDRRVDPGTLVAVELLNRNRNFWHLKLLRVVHVTPRHDERWIVGSAFLKQFTDDEFTSLLE
jgi:hypothetical protein